MQTSTRVVAQRRRSWLQSVQFERAQCVESTRCVVTVSAGMFVTAKCMRGLHRPVAKHALVRASQGARAVETREVRATKGVTANEFSSWVCSVQLRACLLVTRVAIEVV
jgi:hypothetical protein